MSDSNDAFEYVLGSMQGAVRKNLQQRLQQDEPLHQEVKYWEEQLMTFENADNSLPPYADTWHKIESALLDTSPKSAPKFFERWQSWLLAGMSVACMLMFVLLLRNPVQPMPNADYIAVLTDTTGQAKLTAMMLDTDKSMWLQWEDMKASAGQSLQLWAISRRDAEPRSIAIFSQSGVSNLELSEAQWRLITDAEYLVLTQEEAGGSAIDEPSDNVLAKGFCVRYREGKT